MPTWFKVLLIVNVYALFLITLRPDRKDFFLMFWIDFKEKYYGRLIVWCLYCMFLLWTTIPKSIITLYNNHKNK
jgi:hypothetical protein